MNWHDAFAGPKRMISAAVLCATAICALAPDVAAAETTLAGEASASLAIVEPVGAGFSFDIANDAVSAVFLVGDSGDSASLLVSRRRPAPHDATQAGRAAAPSAGGVVVMASGVYRIDLFTRTSGEFRKPVPALMRGTFPGGGSILFLAQFN